MAKKKGLSFYSKKKKISSSVMREVFSWCFGITAAVFLAVVLTLFLGMTIQTVGESMEPVIYSGQKVYVNRFLYLISKPQKGDVVVFLPNGNDKDHYYIKRVVAVPGDHLIIKDGVLYVNGLESRYVTKMIENPGIAVNDITLGLGQYFCIGDNPSSGEDSRNASLGPIELKDIVGKVWFRARSEENGMGFVR